ncbi:ParB/RepB/Spo0J family partition protein [Bacillus mexicanus]|uniref:ParB/RepB/Spo0J family partition protein n=1 Tax=Bacillus mexicanus TaxID=2834415 RepID=UPI003D195C06
MITQKEKQVIVENEIKEVIVNQQAFTQENDSEHGRLDWVPINLVIPNPLNPRKDDSIRTEEMQNIIRTRGWEEPLTVYQNGKMYVLLSGHRRLYAAKQVGGIKKIPVYIKDKPLNDLEEKERLISLQSGRVNWTPFEWAKSTYDRWVAWGKPPINKFAKQINLGPQAVKQYINVLDYFPRTEIEVDLQTGALSMSSLSALVRWIKELSKHKPEFVSSMGEELIRKIMLEKLVSKKVTREELTDFQYTELAKEEDIQNFLIDKNALLSTQLTYLGLNKKFNNFKGHLISIGMYKKRIPEITPKNDHQREQAINALEELNQLVSKRIKELKMDQ